MEGLIEGSAIKEILEARAAEKEVSKSEAFEEAVKPLSMFMEEFCGQGEIIVVQQSGAKLYRWDMLVKL
jgi:20S proteasome alpha/beta subunit